MKKKSWSKGLACLLLTAAVVFMGLSPAQAAGPEGETAVRRFLASMINAEDRPKVSAITNIEAPNSHRKDKGKPS